MIDKKTRQIRREYYEEKRQALADKKARASALLERGVPRGEVAGIIGVSESTIHAWISR